MSTAVYTSDWRSRTKAQLLDDIQIVIEQRDRALGEVEGLRETLRILQESYREAVGSPPSEHQARRLEAMAQTVENQQVEIQRLRDAVGGDS